MVSTVFAQSDATATICFIARFVRRLFESCDYFFHHCWTSYACMVSVHVRARAILKYWPQRLYL